MRLVRRWWQIKKVLKKAHFHIFHVFQGKVHFLQGNRFWCWEVIYLELEEKSKEGTLRSVRHLEMHFLTLSIFKAFFKRIYWKVFKEKIIAQNTIVPLLNAETKLKYVFRGWFCVRTSRKLCFRRVEKNTLGNFKESLGNPLKSQFFIFFKKVF